MAPPVDRDPPEKRQLGRMILHADEGHVATAHPLVTRKRSAIVALVVVGLGTGATVYSVVANGENCRTNQTDPAKPGNCSGSGSHSGFIHTFYSGGSTSHATGAASSVARGGFGATGAAHASAHS